MVIRVYLVTKYRVNYLITILRPPATEDERKRNPATAQRACNKGEFRVVGDTPPEKMLTLFFFQCARGSSRPSRIVSKVHGEQGAERSAPGEGNEAGGEDYIARVGERVSRC